jgi:SAM-dependent methyltransferase
MNLIETFNEIYEKNLWSSSESVSGAGSEIKNTEVIRRELPYLIQKFGIKSILDIPCGDWNWMKDVDLCGASYIGADIVDSLIQTNRWQYRDIDFRTLDITKDELPKVDLIFTRDCLGHLSNDNVLRAIRNCQESGSKYLLATSFTKWNTNPDILDGGWKCINLMIEPFQLNPIYLINEDCKEGYPHYNDKCMILFQLNP